MTGLHDRRADRKARPSLASVRIALLVAVATITIGCTSARPVLEFFFDGLPPEGAQTAAAPVTHAPRRPPYKKPPPMVTFVEYPDLPAPIDWPARYSELPRNDSEQVAWTRALDDKLITPAFGLDPDAKPDDDEPPDEDLEYEPKGKPKYKAFFSHKPHAQWLTCSNCHNAIFAKRKGRAAMTMAKMEDGEQCGVCHGKVAAPDLNDCAVCHPAAKK